MLSRDENRDKYYMLSTWNRRIFRHCLERQWRNFKKEYSLERLLYYGLAVLRSPSVHVWDVVVKCRDDDIPGVIAITMSLTCKKVCINPVNYWS